MLQAMIDTLHHRGPDDAGQWLDSDAGVWLAHRRLSIVDVSSAGRQPMASQSGRYVIVFNGEIYNHASLRSRLAEGRGHDAGAVPAWRGHSDTEVLVEAIAVWGVRETLRRCVGAFALAVWDRAERTLTLARDRFGEKPLYYGTQGAGASQVFLFGSELKALKAHPAFVTTVDRGALASLLQFSYVPAPQSIYVGIHKLEPGCMLTVTQSGTRQHCERYWDAFEAIGSSLRHPFRGTDDEAVDALDSTLREAVGLQMMSDVPLGAFLSGGVDSSTIVALMQAQASSRVKTFTIGFVEQAFDEARYARAVATHLGTDHSELLLTGADCIEIIPRLPALYCEPFADSSQIPTYLVAALARQHVTVSLSGDGGDELFGGYNRYLAGDLFGRRLARIPLALRGAAARALRTLPPGAWDRMLRAVEPLVPSRLRYPAFGDKMHKLATIMSSRTIPELHRQLVSYWTGLDNVVLGMGEGANTPWCGERVLPGAGDVEQMMATDTVTYLPDDILVKLDRATMGASLEGRVPFLDHRVFELAWSLPMSMKMRDGQAKWVLRQLLYRHLPKPMVDRPKMGFGVPIDAWLRGPLRAWADDLLGADRLKREGYLAPERIRRRWSEHLSGRCNWQYPLWNVLMFQAWLQEQHR
jgi:asparagine synthase (glutamine-hydrolysing)